MRMPLAGFPSIDVCHFPSLNVIAFTRWHRFWFRWLRRWIRQKNSLSSYVVPIPFSVVIFTLYDVMLGSGKRTR